MKYSLLIFSIFYCNLVFSNTRHIIYDSLNYPLQYCDHYVLTSVNNYHEGVTTGYIIPQQDFLGTNHYLRKTPYSSLYQAGVFEIVSSENKKCKNNIYSNETFYLIFKNSTLSKSQYLAVSEQNYYYLSDSQKNKFSFYAPSPSLLNRVFLNYQDNLRNNNFIDCYGEYWCKTSPFVTGSISVRLTPVSLTQYSKARQLVYTIIIP